MKPHALAATLALLVPGLLVPVLEINATHLTNPLWPPHARLHEAWQLATNSGICALALWLGWRRARWTEACALGLVVTGGFLVAWLLRDAYGGSMAGTTSAGATWLGIDAAVWVMGLASALLAGAAWRARTRG